MQIRDENLTSAKILKKRVFRAVRREKETITKGRKSVEKYLNLDSS